MSKTITMSVYDAMEQLKEIEDLREEIKKLKEENKNLKLIQQTNEKQIQNDIKERDELREENEELKKNLEEVSKELIEHHEEYKNMADMVIELRKQLDKLKQYEIYMQPMEREGIPAGVGVGIRNKPTKDDILGCAKKLSGHTINGDDELIYEEGLYD